MASREDQVSDAIINVERKLQDTQTKIDAYHEVIVSMNFSFTRIIC